MRRRRVLAGLGSFAAASFAGCLSQTGPPGEGTTTDDETPPDPTTESPTPPPELETSFSVDERYCGSGENSATVRFGEDRIEVDGVIGGSDTCQTASLENVRATDSTLVVRVAAVREPTTGTIACGQCLTDIHYDATVRGRGVHRREVRVVHESGGRVLTVTTAIPN